MKRAEWRARPAKSKERLRIIPPPFVVIHHSAGRECSETEKCKEYIRNIQDNHMDNQGWSDIGYNFIVSSVKIIPNAQRTCRFISKNKIYYVAENFLPSFLGNQTELIKPIFEARTGKTFN